jgi:hypothetical protein
MFQSSGENRPIHYWSTNDMLTHAGEATLIDPTPEMLEALHRAGRKTTDHYDGVIDVVTVE